MLFIYTYFLKLRKLSWENAHKAKLKKLASRQKQAIRTIESDTVRRTTEKMEKLNILNFYKITVYISPIFILRIKNNTMPYAFYERFTNINHQYPNRFCQNNFVQNKLKFPRTKFAISSCGSRLWNNILTALQNQCTSQNSFEESIKETLLKVCNEFDYF